MDKKRKYNRLYGFDYSKNGAYFLTFCTHDRQKLFGDTVIIPNGWYPETDQMQYGDEKLECDQQSTPVGATPCGRPMTVTMVEKWIHKIPEKFENATIDYYVIMPDHVHLILFLIDNGDDHPVCMQTVSPLQKNGGYNERDDHMGSPLQGKSDKHGKYTVSNIMDWFKTMTTNEYIRMVKCCDLPPFNKHVWDRSFYDRVIRNQDELYEIRKYIKDNPVKWMYK